MYKRNCFQSFCFILFFISRYFLFFQFFPLPIHRPPWIAPDEDICSSLRWVSTLANGTTWRSMCGRLARKSRINMYMCSGPLYLTKMETDVALNVKYKVIGHSRVDDGFFKVVLIERTVDNFELELDLLQNALFPDEKLLITDFLLLSLDTTKLRPTCSVLTTCPMRC
ncbi:hypothetical protein niasHT_022116 [Heterodera trifolii]|uniref:Effector protein n=1 Tax=Heterodera trifolii TaxID=157864 RepID=A0ABD2K954_9BILA